MKTKFFWLIFFTFVIALTGCGEKKEKPKPGYQPNGNISRELQYYYHEAVRHLNEIKKVSPSSHWHIRDFWEKMNQGGFLLDTFKITQTEMDSLELASWQQAAASDLKTLRSMQKDGDYNRVVANIRFYASEASLTLTDFGTTDKELDDLLINNKKSAARRIVTELELRSRENTLDKVDVQDYIDRLWQYSDETEQPLEVFGTSESRLQEIIYQGYDE